MNLARETILLFRNTAIVTGAVILGFVVGSAVGIPGWLQAFCLVPAVYLFFWLSGTARPAGWKLIGFLTVLSGLTFVFSVVFPHFPEGYQTFVFMLFVMSVGPVAKWLERRFAKPPIADAENNLPSINP